MDFKEFKKFGKLENFKWFTDFMDFRGIQIISRKIKDLKGIDRKFKIIKIIIN